MGGGKTAKADTAVQLHSGQKVVVIGEQTAADDFDTAEVTLKCNPDGIDKTDGSGQEYVSFNPYVKLEFSVTVDGNTKVITVDGTDGTYSVKELVFTLEGLGIKKGQTFKIEAITNAYESVGSEPWLYEISINCPLGDSDKPTAVQLHSGVIALVVDEQIAVKDFDVAEVTLKCNPNGIDKTDGSGQEYVSFNPYVKLEFNVTVDGNTKAITVEGTDGTYSVKELTFSLEGLGIEKGQTFKIEALTNAYESVGSEPWLYEISINYPLEDSDCCSAN